jgi:hypothetical protein
VSRYLPWLLDGASPERTVLVLARMPEQLVAAPTATSGDRPTPG